MQATKESILGFLSEMKPMLSEQGISRIGLFGSFASDSQNAYSDIDIAIAKNSDYLKQFSSCDYFNLIAFIREKTIRTFHRNTDVFDLDSQSPLKTIIEKELIDV